MSFVAVAIGGAAVVGGVTSVIAGNKAAGAAKDAAATQSATDKYIFDTAREDNAPWSDVGQGALGKLAKMYGISMPDRTPKAPTYSPSAWFDPFSGGSFDWTAYAPPAAATTPASTSEDRFSDFFTSPGYEFRLNEGMKAIERSAAARGKRLAPETMKAVGDYAQNSASDEYARYTGNLFQLAGFGSQANQANQQAGAQFAANQAQTNAQMGAARASAYANTGNAINNTVGNLAGMYLYTQGYGKR